MATLTTIRTRLENRLKDIADIDNSVLFQMATDLNQHLYNEMFQCDPERFITTQSYAISTAPQTETLPADYRDAQPFGCGFFLQNDDGTDTDIQLKLTGFGSSDMGYYINGANVIFTGIDSSKTVVLRYLPTLADITALGDSFVAPEENKELILEGMVLYYYRYEEDARELEQDQRFSRLLDRFLNNLRKAPRVYNVTNFSSAY